MTAAELAAKLLALPADTQVTVWDAYDDEEAWAHPVLHDVHPGRVLITSSGRTVASGLAPL